MEEGQRVVSGRSGSKRCGVEVGIIDEGIEVKKVSKAEACASSRRGGPGNGGGEEVSLDPETPSAGELVRRMERGRWGCVQFQES